MVGFSSAVKDMMFEYGGVIIVDGDINDIRIIGTASLVFVGAICGLGAQYETKVYTDHINCFNDLKRVLSQININR